MLNFLTILFSVLLAYEIKGKSLPANIHKCSKSDAKFNDCFRVNLVDGFKKFKDGNRDYGINRLEPFFVEKLDLGNQSSGSVSISQTYKNVNMFGFSTSTVLNMDANFNGTNCYWRFNAFTPILRMEADYEIRGQVLVFPLNGNGKCVNTLYDLQVKHNMKCERYKKKNKTHLRIVDYSLEMTPKKVVFDFKNVVAGNEQLSREINKTINENSLVVYADVKQGFADSFSLIYKTVANSFFAKVPEEELFLP